MITRQDNVIQPWKRIRQAAGLGALSAAELAALIVAGSEASLVQLILTSLAFAFIGAAGAALLGFVIGGRRRDTLGDLEHELTKASAILERGLIDEAEFSRIKGQILEQYHYSPRSRVSVMKWALWGASVG